MNHGGDKQDHHWTKRDANFGEATDDVFHTTAAVEVDYAEVK